MKLLYCQQCEDIVAPLPKARETRSCLCGRHIVWWENPAAGDIRLCDALGSPGIVRARGGRPAGRRPRAWVIGLTNSLLHHPGLGTPDEAEVQRLVDAHPDSYIFRQTRSLVIRIRPGMSSDSDWALPYGWPDPWPLLPPGTPVLTASELTGRDYVADAVAVRRAGLEGVVVGHHDSHGRCYDVRHSDGSVAPYDPDELSLSEPLGAGP